MGKHQGPKPEKTESAHCKVKACKHSPGKFGFCTEHFDQFKFGLITKAGEPCADYDKKSEQYDHFKKDRKSA